MASAWESIAAPQARDTALDGDACVGTFASPLAKRSRLAQPAWDDVPLLRTFAAGFYIMSFGLFNSMQTQR